MTITGTATRRAPWRSQVIRPKPIRPRLRSKSCARWVDESGVSTSETRCYQSYTGERRAGGDIGRLHSRGFTLAFGGRGFWRSINSADLSSQLSPALTYESESFSWDGAFSCALVCTVFPGTFLCSGPNIWARGRNNNYCASGASSEKPGRSNAEAGEAPVINPEMHLNPKLLSAGIEQEPI